MAGKQHNVKVNGVELAAETFGDSSDPAILLVHGAGHSLAAWEQEFIQRLVTGGRQVIRYDSRDAGQSTSFPVGAPSYTLRDVVEDAAGLIEAVELSAAHVVGMSQGAAVAQLLALEYPSRVASLTLASASPGGPGHEQPDLPRMTEELEALFSDEAAGPDWSDRSSVVDYLVEAERPFAASSRPYDEPRMRLVAGRLADHAANIAAQLTNPYLLDPGEPWRDRIGKIEAPTLVLHGTEDPLFPIGHGEALAAEIPGARFIAMEQTGHEVFPPHRWDVVIPAILEHTAGR